MPDLPQGPAEAVEVHPVTADRWDDLVALAGERGFTGTSAMFRRAGFSEVARREGRPIVRVDVATRFSRG